MKRVILVTLKKDNAVEEVRKKYLPNYVKIEPHITLVYPFEFADTKKLKELIKQTIIKIKSFHRVLEGLDKSEKDYYLYLSVKTGENELIELRNTLLSAGLNKFENIEMPKYIPHLSLGVFKTKEEIDKAKAEISKMPLSLEEEIRSIQLLTFDKGGELVKVESFRLAG